MSAQTTPKLSGLSNHHFIDFLLVLQSDQGSPGTVHMTSYGWIKEPTLKTASRPAGCHLEVQLGLLAGPLATSMWPRPTARPASHGTGVSVFSPVHVDEREIGWAPSGSRPKNDIGALPSGSTG